MYVGISLTHQSSENKRALQMYNYNVKFNAAAQTICEEYLYLNHVNESIVEN